ncbi:MAG TPA: hypothetical protein VFC19_20650 [Candidatus Limnocylindrales bacterium]|nr:hypothetical protein [Candidatus Limnocylindrales bacterium]
MLRAPLSGLECVWYRVRAHSWQVHGDAHHWRPVVGIQRGNPFAVGSVLVDAELAESETVVEEEVRGRKAPSEPEAPMLHRLFGLGLLPGDELKRGANAFDELAWRVTEEIIRPAREMSVRGKLVTRRGRATLRRPLFGWLS